jgi:ATP-dependent Clp protease adaptor protein ClpS
MIELLKDTDPLKKVSEEVLVEEDAGYNLVVWNDDVNTFDWVIKALVEICRQNEEQAEQCALIIHLRGKYAVKQGDFDTLKPMCEGIIDRGINATIEEVAL